MAIPTTALIPLILMCFLIAGGLLAFAKIATTPEPSMPSAYYMYSRNYETGTDRNTSIVTTPERAHVSPGDVERGMGSGGGPSVREIREMAYAGEERRISVQREGSYGNGGYPDRAYDQRGYDQRGYDQRGYDQRVYDQRGYDQRGYDQRGHNGDRPYSGGRGMSPPQRPAMYPAERAMGPVAAGNTKEMVYDGGERGVVQDSGERGMVQDGGERGVVQDGDERGMVQTSTPSS